MGEYNELYHHGIKGQKWGVRRTAAQLGHRNSINYTKHSTFYLGSTSYGKNPNCEIRIRNNRDKAIVNRVLIDKAFESKMTKSAVDKLYAKSDKAIDGVTRKSYEKDVAAYLIDVKSSTHNGRTSDVAIHYHNLGDGNIQTFLVDSKSKTIINL